MLEYNIDEYKVENLDKSIQYSEYIAENLDKAIQYSEYIAENLDKSTQYSEYLAANLNGHSEEYYEKERIRKSRNKNIDKLLK